MVLQSKVLLSLLASIAGLAGCQAQGDFVWQKLPRYRPGGEPQVQMTATPGAYVVAVREQGAARLAVMRETKTYLNGGESIGFRCDERGHVIAYTRRGEHDLGPAREDVKYLCWTVRRYEEGDVVDENVEEAVVGVAGELAMSFAVAAAMEVMGCSGIDETDARDRPLRKYK